MLFNKFVRNKRISEFRSTITREIYRNVIFFYIGDQLNLVMDKENDRG